MIWHIVNLLRHFIYRHIYLYMYTYIYIIQVCIDKYFICASNTPQLSYIYIYIQVDTMVLTQVYKTVVGNINSKHQPSSTQYNKLANRRYKYIHYENYKVPGYVLEFIIFMYNHEYVICCYICLRLKSVR